ncbi:hypothetical protein D9M73_219150 [compost metagenome]
MIGRGVDQLFGQFHFVAAIAIKCAADQHVARQFHLTDHAYLGKTGVAVLVTGRIVARSIFAGVRRSPDDTVDAQQAQTGPSRMVSCFMPTFLSQVEDLSYGFAT